MATREAPEPSKEESIVDCAGGSVHALPLLGTQGQHYHYLAAQITYETRRIEEPAFGA
jgi:hypothetical protein